MTWTGERGRIKRLKAALRRPPKRPPCSDDPVFWCEVHATRRVGLARRILALTIKLAWFASLAAGTWYLARPAFEELTRRGYRSSPEAFSAPELHPAMRLLIKSRMPTFAPDASPGQARLEFNMMLRAFTAIYAFAWITATFSGTIETLRTERKRDTWLGLIATPLTGREILRGKALGTLWKARELPLTMIALWLIGLACGAVHPLGFLAGLALLAASSACFASLGLLASLLESEHATQEAAPFQAILLAPLIVGSFLVAIAPLALFWACLFSYEDLDAASRSAPFPQFFGPLREWVEARSVVAAWLIGTSALALGAYRVARSNGRRFNRSIGRPIRAHETGTRPAHEAGSAPVLARPVPALDRIRTPDRP